MRAPSLCYSENKAIYTKIRTFSKYDELRFEICYPYEEKEKWAVDYEKPGIHGLKIFVNGQELYTLLVELEDKENGDGEHTDPAEVYGHNCLGIALSEFQSRVRDPDGCCSAAVPNARVMDAMM